MTQIQMIALRIADLRDILGLTQEDVANRSQVPLEDYIEYEKGEKDFSFSHLFNIAEALGVDISDLLTGESPKLKGYILTRNGKGLVFDRRRQVVKQAHSHEGQEFDYVLEGYLRIILGGNELLLAPGDSVYYDSSLPHVMYAPEGDCRFIAVVIKSGANE